jgi:GH15 family glucan-1,4-alpha-glucosidase
MEHQCRSRDIDGTSMPLPEPGEGRCRSRVREARVIFEMMLTSANHLGLYAAQIGASGEALGDFPQAFTRLALISAAVNLHRARDR